MSPIYIYQVGQVVKVVKGRDGDGEIRSLQVILIKGSKMKKIARNVRRFSLLDLDDVKLPTNDSNEPTKFT